MAKGHFFLGLVIGSAAAIGAALLLTPETAEDIKKRASLNSNKLKNRASELYQIADDATADWREDAAEKVNQVLSEHESLHYAVDTSSKAVQQFKDTFQDATEQMKSQFGDVSEQLKSSFEQTKDAADNVDSDDFDDIVLDSQSAFQEAQDEVADSADDVKDDAAKAVEDVKDTAAEVKSTVSKGASEVKEDAKDVVADSKSVAKDSKDAVVDTARTAKKSAAKKVADKKDK